MSDEYFHIRTKDVRKIAETVYEHLAGLLGYSNFGCKVNLRDDIINDIERIINDHEKKLGNKDEI